MTSIFRRDASGRRPVFGDVEKMQNDPHFKDHILFHEYFDGESGRGLGASHQTGWSALVANVIAEMHEDPETEGRPGSARRSRTTRRTEGTASVSAGPR